MLLNPVQQTPLPYDPARQQLTPPLPGVVQGPPPAADQPLQSSEQPRDKSGTGYGGDKRPQDGTGDPAQQAETAEKLRDAWLRLQELKQEAGQALVAGDTRGAKAAAQEAAEVATSIRDLTGSGVSLGLGPIEAAANQPAPQQNSGNGTGTGSSNGTSSGTSSSGTSNGTNGDTDDDNGPDVLGLARAGLGTANDVVDTAASSPSYDAEDRRSIDGYKRAVLDAMAGVEALAAKAAGPSSGLAGSGGGSLLDIKA